MRSTPSLVAPGPLVAVHNLLCGALCGALRGALCGALYSTLCTVLSTVLGTVLCSPSVAAQDAPAEDLHAPPPGSAATELPVPGRLGLAPSARRLGEPLVVSVREAAALPPRAVLEADASAEDAPIIRSMIQDEAVHRGRVARIQRLRALATTQGRRDLLGGLDRLQGVERQRHEARALMARTQLSEPGFVATESFMRQGGIMRLRHAQARANGREVRGADAGARLHPQQRAGARMLESTTRGAGARAAPANGTGRSGGGRSGSSGPR
jgi:hypothetical protein